MRVVVKQVGQAAFAARIETWSAADEELPGRVQSYRDASQSARMPGALVKPARESRNVKDEHAGEIRFGDRWIYGGMSQRECGCLCLAGIHPGCLRTGFGGMYTGGDLLLLIGVFGVLASIPTGLAVYFLFRRLPTS